MISNDPKRRYSEKEKYIQSRAGLISDFLALFEQRIHQGTKERCSIIIAGFFDDPHSRIWLQELSIDISNAIYWKTSHLPSIIRFALSRGEDTSRARSTSLSDLLNPIRVQYFRTERFELDSSRHDSAGASTNSKKDERKLTASTIRINPYDILTCATGTAALETFLKKILPLQKLEVQYATQHLSSEYGSGGSLYLVEGKLVSSVSGWRRVDWLVLAQVSFLPRYWPLSDPQVLEEFCNLFDYRHWVSRFDGLEENDQSNLQIVTYADGSDRKAVKRALKDLSKLNLQRRKREANWEGVSTVRNPSDIKLRSKNSASATNSSSNTSKNAETTNWDPKEGEKNEYRITEGNFEIVRELVVYLHREKRFAESLKVLKQLMRNVVGVSPFSMKGRKKSAPKSVESEEARKSLHAEFDKLEGISLLGIGDAEAAVQKLTQYRDHLERVDEDAKLLGKRVDAASSARVWAEVASVYCACSNFSAAQAAACKSLALEATQPSALKTLLLAAGRSGESSMVEEDWIFGFFINSKSLQLDDAHEYYLKRTQKFPENGFFWYGLAMFLFVMCRQLKPCLHLFERAHALLPNEARVAESYATFLFQTRSPKLKLIQLLYDSALALDPSNLLIRANNAAFHLFFRSAQLDRLMESEEVQLNKNRHKTQIASHPKISSQLPNARGSSASRSKSPSTVSSGEDYYIPEDQLADAQRKDVLDGFDLAQSNLESVLFSVSLVDLHPQVYLECWFYVLCYTMEKDRLIQAMQYLKAALRKGLRARNWDMSAHLQYVRKHALIDDEDIEMVPTLMRVIADRAAMDALDSWPLWKSLRCDTLVSNLKLSANSFRVCVSPSKRRETMEEPVPTLSNMGKSKSAPLKNILSFPSSLKDDSPYASSPSQRKLTPKNTDLGAKKSSSRTISAKRSSSKSPTTGISDSTGSSTKKSTVTDVKSSENEEEDMLSLLESHSVTSGPASISTSRSSLTHSTDELSALDISTSSFTPDGSTSSYSKLRRASSGVSASLFANLSVSVPSRLAKSKTTPLDTAVTSSSSGAKPVATKRVLTANSRATTATKTTDKIQGSSKEDNSDMLWQQMRSKYDLDEDKEMADKKTPAKKASSSASSRAARATATVGTKKTSTPTFTDDFEEEVPRRPTRAAVSEPKASKRPRRI